MSNRRYWKTKSGQKIRIKDMSDSHLINTINMLLRVSSESRNVSLCYFPDFQGEMAQFYAEREWDRLNEMSDMEFAYTEIDIFRDLVAEAKRRKLMIRIDQEFEYVGSRVEQEYDPA